MCIRDSRTTVHAGDRTAVGPLVAHLDAPDLGSAGGRPAIIRRSQNALRDARWILRVTIGAVGLLALGFGCSGGNSAPIVCSPGSSTGQLDTRSAGIAAVAADETHIAFLRDPVTTEAGCLARGASLTTGTLVAASIQR